MGERGSDGLVKALGEPPRVNSDAAYIDGLIEEMFWDLGRDGLIYADGDAPSPDRA